MASDLAKKYGLSFVRQIRLPVAGLYLLSLSLVIAYRRPPDGNGAATYRTPPPHTGADRGGGAVKLRRYFTFVTADGVSTFSDRFARLSAALAFVFVQPPVPVVLLALARLGEIPMAPSEAARASTVRALHTRRFLCGLGDVVTAWS